MGNLIIGNNTYYENHSHYQPVQRTGSHSIIMGRHNSYAGVDNFVGGWNNHIYQSNSVILTGNGNEIGKLPGESTGRTVILTGSYNQAWGSKTLIGTGYENTVTGNENAIIGGFFNTIQKDEGSVAKCKRSNAF